MGDKLGEVMEKSPREGPGLEAKPPPQIGLILHGRLCRAPSLEGTLIASFALSHPSKGKVIKIRQ